MQFLKLSETILIDAAYTFVRIIIEIDIFFLQIDQNRFVTIQIFLRIFAHFFCCRLYIYSKMRLAKKKKSTHDEWRHSLYAVSAWRCIV